MKIVIRKNGSLVEEINVSEGASFNVGRQPDVNDIIINDIKASRKHGKLTITAEKAIFEDLGSGNGTFIGEERIEANTPVDILPGKSVSIGEMQICFEDGEAAASAPTAPSAPKGESNLPEGKTGMLEGIDGGFAGKQFGLGDRPIFLGRVPACHIQLQDIVASRRNTEISLEGTRYRIKDLGSSNGTFINEEKIEEAFLCDGDVLKAGETSFKFSFIDKASAPVVPTPQTMADSSAQVRLNSDTSFMTRDPGHGKKSAMVPAIIATCFIGLLVAGGVVYYLFS
ncbi:MAG: FHA domain-containing protein, partial [Planctomycetes bacterium]|nr:FHA domain-containing protein [Planctomycetota bacterium]